MEGKHPFALSLTEIRVALAERGLDCMGISHELVVRLVEAVTTVPLPPNPNAADAAARPVTARDPSAGAPHRRILRVRLGPD